jgi:hypothetical protein
MHLSDQAAEFLKQPAQKPRPGLVHGGQTPLPVGLGKAFKAPTLLRTPHEGAGA